jgi:hypothetical protein
MQERSVPVVHVHGAQGGWPHTCHSNCRCQVYGGRRPQLICTTCSNRLLQECPPRPLRCLLLFAGGGGDIISLHEANIQVHSIVAVEPDEQAWKIWMNNFR